MIPRIERPPAIDGRLDEPLWDSLVPLPMVTYKPTFGLAPSESTDVRVAHDGRAFYVGAALYHRDPAGVQAWSRGRDEDNGGDFLNVLLDTFNDSENAVTFSTTPAGPRLDFSVADRCGRRRTRSPAHGTASGTCAPGGTIAAGTRSSGFRSRPCATRRPAAWFACA